jgi:hypothetical protein
MASARALGRLILPLAVLGLHACGGGDAQQAGGQAQAQSQETVSQAAQVTANPRRFSGLAVNLSSLEYWSTDLPTIDQFKRASTWVTSCEAVNTPYDPGTCTFNQADKDQGKSAWDTLEEARLDLDENGWVRSIPAVSDPNVKFHEVTSLVFQGDGGAHPAGTYTVLYDGQGDIDFQSGGSVTRVDAHRVLVEVSNKPDSAFFIRIRSTVASDYIRNIRVYPPGGVCSNARLVVVGKAADCTGTGNSFINFETLSQTQTWYPTFRAHLNGMRALRFMDWGRTNDSMLANWADRPKKSDATWTGKYGVPLAAMVSLANSVQSDAWINIPTEATDDYAHNAGRFLKGQLDPQAQVLVEYNNEPWNGQFRQYNAMYDKAVSLWGVPDDKKGQSKHEWVLNYHAMRLAQVCDIVKSEFGADAGRVKCVLNAQASGGSWNVLNVSLPCPKGVSILGHACEQSIDVVAIAPYFGVYIAQGNARQDYITANWFNQPDAGIGKLFEEIRAKDANDNVVVPPLYAAGKTGAEQKNGALAEARGWMDDYRKALAGRKPLYAYEGGQHLVNLYRDCGGLSGDALKACQDKGAAFVKAWTKLFSDASHHALMGRSYTTMMDDWKAADLQGNKGQVFAAFNFVSSYSQWGAWGLKETLFDSDAVSPKWQALLPYRDSISCWWDHCQDLTGTALDK